MKHCLLLGATGLVGSQLLDELLRAPEVERVTAITRRPLSLRHTKLVNPVQSLADDQHVVVPEMPDTAFCCLGTTIKAAGSRKAFRQVDYYLPLAFARQLQAGGCEHFLAITAMGASTRSPSFYSRVKGEVERDLIALQFPKLSLVRPSLLLGQRDEKRLAEELGQKLSRLVNPLIPANYRAIPAAEVARAMLVLARNRDKAPRVNIVESGRLHQLGS